MSEPVIVPRAEHPISRRDIDADALKVLYRLHESGNVAYLVGGSVRDLLLSRRPKDFDIGTSAHPYQVKKLFRNCWIIGRRFRLAHVRFGTKTIEVATFRRNVPAGSENEPAEPAEPEVTTAIDPAEQGRLDAQALLLNKHHDNTFGTPEEDAFRRDFTVNALFYDIGTFSIIDYVGGLRDLKDGLIRCIGDPNERFQEDPVRMLRAIVMASRLGFRLDPPIVEAIARHRHLMASASAARLIEEYYKILRSGYAELTFRSLAEHRLLEPVTPEIQRGARNDALWTSLAALDAYRRKFDAAPPTLRNPVLLGTVLIPLGLMPRHERPVESARGKHFDPAEDSETEEDNVGNVIVPRAAARFRRPPKEPILKIGMLPIARGDTERLRQLLSLQSRIADVEMSPRAKRALIHRGPFEDALTWFDIHGHAPATVEHWKGFIEALGDEARHAPAAGADAEQPSGDGRRRRRGRRRRGRRSFGSGTGNRGPGTGGS
ncbi:MAG TPA: polynucleotide adenylyltransferase PcnB [Vicinamibacterales bacterium]|nr:polynucleotide adenylyltransferase PcnB [Vicinamibacterales bacterium]